MADAKTKQEKIKAFVQQVLGCGCAEEVFNLIETSQVWVEDVDCLRINVGNRLLVYLIDTDDAVLVDSELGNLVARGVEDRDRNGFNRFRLVIAAERVKQLERNAKKAFKAIGPDDKVHLHVVPRDSIDFIV